MIRALIPASRKERAAFESLCRADLATHKTEMNAPAWAANTRSAWARFTAYCMADVRFTIEFEKTRKALTE